MEYGSTVALTSHHSSMHRYKLKLTITNENGYVNVYKVAYRRESNGRPSREVQSS